MKEVALTHSVLLKLQGCEINSIYYDKPQSCWHYHVDLGIDSDVIFSLDRL